MTGFGTGEGMTGEALLESMQAVQRALMKPPGLSSEKLIACIQEWRQAVTELTGGRLYSVELATLYEIVGVLNSSLDLTKTLDLVMDALIHLTGAERGCLMLLNEEGNLEARAVQNFGQESGDAFDLELSYTVVRDSVKKGRPVLTTNAQLDPRFSEQESVIGYQLRSIVCIPLYIRGSVIGALYLDNRMRDGAFSEADLPILTAFANQAAVAIENARLHTMTDQALAARVEELTVLYRASRLIGEATSFQEIARGAAEIAPLLNMTACALIVVTATDGRHVPVHGDVYSVLITEDGFTSMPPTFDCPIVDQQAARSTSKASDFILVHTEAQDAGSPIPPRAQEAVLGIAVRSTVTASLNVHGHTIGFLIFSSSEPLADFPESRRRRLRTVADQVAPAVYNLRLLEETRRRAREMEVINEVGRAVTSVLDLDIVFRQIVAVTKARFGHYFVGIALVEGDQLVFRSMSTIGNSGLRPDLSRTRIALTDGPGLIAEAARTGQPILVNDTSSDPRYLEVPELPGTRSELCVPIKARGRVIGVLDVQSNQPFAYDQSDVDVLLFLASQASVAIENALLFEQVRGRAKELAVLNELGQALTTRLNVDEVLDEAHREVSRLLDTTNFYIALYDADKDEVTFALDVTGGDVRKFIGTRRTGEGLTEYIIRHRAPLLIQEDLPGWLERMGVKPVGRMALSWLGVPLVVGDRVLGVMAVQSYTTPRAYDEHDRDLLTAIASQVAIAIQNARLYEQAQREITERKRVEERLQHYAAELERANEEVKRFAYIVSHDLRVPLINVKGFATELRLALNEIHSLISMVLPHLDEKQGQDIVRVLQEDTPEALEFIESAVAQMDHFINALLKLSRLGRRELKLEPIDVPALVQATLQTMAHQIAEHQVKVTVGPLPEVVADQTSMEQIIGNILGNAVKYLVPGRPGEIEITAERSDGETIFHIRDNGRGIAEEDMNKVFAPFRRAGEQDVPGEGMGLAYVETLVHRHGGRIWCESELGVGTTFTFTISNHLENGGGHA